jgi:DNA-binding NarL/FixJ family response regulator
MKDVPIRIVLADDHPIVLQGLEQLFARQPDFDVVGTCADAQSALETVRAARPDVLVLDLRMPGTGGVGGLDVLRHLSTESLPCRTVLLTAAVRDEEVVEAVRLGATGLVLKEASPDTLLAAVRSVHRGESWIDKETVTRAFRSVIDREAAGKEITDAVTPRELEIVNMVAQGLRNKAIAERLGISEGTVKVHLHNIYEKLGVDGRIALMLCAREKGLL